METPALPDDGADDNQQVDELDAAGAAGLAASPAAALLLAALFAWLR